MRILLTGRNGQVGWELERALAALGELAATDLETLDLADANAIRRAVREVKPDVIVNAAAYTAVDRAEREPEQAMRINGVAPGILAEEAKRSGALLVHYSTDYVFDGTKRSPYLETDEPGPLNAYGRSKLAGERAIQAAGARHLILRTSWIYGLRGRNFLRAILEKAGRGERLQVVDDQTGAPTWCRAVAETTSVLLRSARPEGTYHLSAGGETTWHGFAKEILRLSRTDLPIEPVKTDSYVTAAKRPRCSLLDNRKLQRDFGIALAGWEAYLEECLKGPHG